MPNVSDWRTRLQECTRVYCKLAFLYIGNQHWLEATIGKHLCCETETKTELPYTWCRTFLGSSERVIVASICEYSLQPYSRLKISYFGDMNVSVEIWMCIYIYIYKAHTHRHATSSLLALFREATFFLTYYGHYSLPLLITAIITMKQWCPSSNRTVHHCRSVVITIDH